MELLLKEYQETLKAAREMRKAAPDYDQKVHAGIITNLEFIIKWLKTSQMPMEKKYGKAFWDDEWDEFSSAHADPYSMNAFEEAEDRIDAEMRRRKRA